MLFPRHRLRQHLTHKQNTRRANTTVIEMKAAKKPARQKNCYKTSLLKCMVAQGDESHVVKGFSEEIFLTNQVRGLFCKLN